MLKMMVGFFKGLWQYRDEVKKQRSWIGRFAAKKNYAVNPNWMMSTNLQVWLSEMEATFGRRYCPCFEPSGDSKLNRQILCPCEFIDDEIEEYGTCHCALFGATSLDKDGWKASSKRLMKEYRVPLSYKDGVLDTRNKPLDPRRNLPIPDAMHQVKTALNGYGRPTLTVLVEREQEVLNLEKLASYRGYGFGQEEKEGHLEVILHLGGTSAKGTNASCGN